MKRCISCILHEKTSDFHSHHDVDTTKEPSKITAQQIIREENMLNQILDYIRFHGLSYTLRHAAEKITERYFRTYDRLYRSIEAQAETLTVQKEQQHDCGMFSVLIPVYNTDPELLCALLDSLLAQTEKNWEACLYNAGNRAETESVLSMYASRDPRFRVVKGANGGISANTNAVLKIARGKWVVLCDHDDILTPDALWLIAEKLSRTDADAIYTDEDKIAENGSVYTDPHAKPDFAPDTLRSSNYICHLLCIKKSVMEKLGGERSAYDGSQDHELVLRLSEITQKIVHLRRICYHWRTVGNSVSHANLSRCMDASCRAVEDHAARLGWTVKACPDHGVIHLVYDVEPSLSVDILLYGAKPEDAEEIRRITDWHHLTVTPLDASLPRYAAYNKAADASQADVLFFLDASVTSVQPQTVREMLMYAQRPDVGGVTTALTDARGRLTHAGFTFPMSGYAACRQAGLPLRAGGYHILARQVQNVGGLSSACIMVRKKAFLPFDEAYHSGLGAVEWSIRMLNAGFVHVYTPYGAMECENRSLLLLGPSRDPDDIARLEKDYANMTDPYYHPWFNRKRANFHLDRSEILQDLKKESFVL